MDSVPQKRCSKCGQYYPPTTEYFKPEKRNRNGLNAQCYNCTRAYDHERYQRPAVKARAKELRNTPDVIAKKREYYHIPENKERILARMKTPEARAREKELRARPSSKAYYKRHKQTPRYKAYDKAYRQRPHVKEMNKTKQAKRRAKQINLPYSFTLEDWFKALAHFDNKCAVCGRPAGLWHTLAQDHWIPLAGNDCPGTVAFNIVPLCNGLDGCNNSKGSKPAERWLIEQFGKRKAKEIIARVKAYFDRVKAA